MAIPDLTSTPTDMVQAIQLALSPAFLLTGIAGILNVMAGRLARIIDRGRRLTEDKTRSDSLALDSTRHELRNLERRRHLASAAITFCTLAALLVCTVVAALFVEVLFATTLKWLLGGLFTAATVSLVVGLSFFLREVHMATHTIRIPSHELED